jgi:predicted dehydrogenase
MQNLGVSFIGAGNFARGVLLRHLVKMPEVRLQGVISASGVSALSAAKRFGFGYCASQTQDVLGDDQTDCVFIATQHSQHADLVCEALRAGKHVFVEKPLAISLDQLRDVSAALEESSRSLLVGFNRRFAPLAVKLKEHFRGSGKLHITYRCNAGTLPPGSWHADPTEGGRIVGEACHFVDFCSFLAGSRPAMVYATGSGIPGQDDSAAITLQLEDSSLAQILYTAEGSPRQAKEYIQVFGGGRSAALDDFRRLTLHDGKRSTRHGGWLGQDKGHRSELKAWVDALRCGEESPIPRESLIDTALVVIAAMESQRTGQAIGMQTLEESLHDESDKTS